MGSYLAVPLQSTNLQGKADSRVCLVLSVVFTLSIWRANFLALCVYLPFFVIIWYRFGLFTKASFADLKKLLFFCLFWVILALILSSFHLVTQTPSAMQTTSIQTNAGMQKLLFRVGLMFVRLFSLLLTSYTLLRLCSAHSLGLAVYGFARPFFGKSSWKVALSLSMMAQYLWFILDCAGKTRKGIISRGLASKGFAYWRLAFPHFCSLIAASTQQRAIAIVVRGVDSPEAWQQLEPLGVNATLKTAFACFGILSISFLSY